ncbi:hypothetical protein TWF694_009015 [Orbilia ellipsospora]|uniref:Uncharacterized protein n=1 Tax=Orbilia ellipsospora TaxID=2528407 RepID=A0AAV9XE10_9PEZI
MAYSKNWRSGILPLAIIFSNVVLGRWLEIQQWKRVWNVLPNIQTGEVDQHLETVESYTTFTDYDAVWTSGGCANGVVSNKGSLLRTIRYSPNNFNPAFPFVLAGIEVHQGDDCMDPDPAYVEFPTDPERWDQEPQIYAGYLQDDLFHQMMEIPTLFDDHVNGINDDGGDNNGSFNIAPFELNADFMEHFDEYEEPTEPEYDEEGFEDLKKRSANPQPQPARSRYAPYDISDDGSIGPRTPPEGLATNNDNSDDWEEHIEAEEEDIPMGGLDASTYYTNDLPFAETHEFDEPEADVGFGEEQSGIAIAPIEASNAVALDSDFTDLPILEINMLEYNFRFTQNTSIRFISDFSAWHRAGGVVERFLQMPNRYTQYNFDSSSDDDDDGSDGYNIHAAAAVA